MATRRGASGVDRWVYIWIGIPAIFFGMLVVCLLGAFIATTTISNLVVNLLSLGYMMNAPERVEEIALICDLVITVVVGVTGAVIGEACGQKRVGDRLGAADLQALL